AAVGGEIGLALVVLAREERTALGGLGVEQPQIPLAFDEALVDDQTAVGRDAGKTRAFVFRRQRLRAAAARGQPPEAAEEVDDERLAIGKDREREIRALADVRDALLRDGGARAEQVAEKRDAERGRGTDSTHH